MNLAFQKIDITPRLPVLLSGFGKQRLATSVHDSLYARIFLFKDDLQEILWIQLDLTAIDQELIQLISEKTGISQEQMLISATHTHSAFGGTINTSSGLLKGMESVFGGSLNLEYCKYMAQLIHDAVIEMRKNVSPVSLRMIQGKVLGLGTDRHDPTLEGDEDALILELTTDKNKTLIVRLACHPTVLNADNLEVSADFPGAIEAHLDDYDCVAYVNGSCGDISTRFTRKNSGFDEWERFGKLAADQIKALLEGPSEVIDDFSLELTQKYFSVKARKTDTLEEAQVKLKKAMDDLKEAERQNLPPQELRLVQSFVEGAQNNYLAAKTLGNIQEIQVPVSALKLPGITLIFTPIELFSKLSNPLKQYGLEFVGYTNGYQMYMPDIQAYEKNFYEANSSPYACGAGEKLMNDIKNWIV